MCGRADHRGSKVHGPARGRQPCHDARMRRTHETRRAPRFTLAYWAVIVAVLGLPTALLAAQAVATGTSPLAALALPSVIVVGVFALLLWRWNAHQLEVTDAAVIERRHPLLVYVRRRRLDEIVEVVECPADRRGVEHGPGALLLRCERPERDLVLAPANTEQFLEDLATVNDRFAQYRGRIARDSR